MWCRIHCTVVCVGMESRKVEFREFGVLRAKEFTEDRL
jgi:hypothetical protein